MLFPTPKAPEFSSEQDPRLSFAFSGTQQTSRAGTPVTLVYGEIFTGSVVISSSIDTEQVQVLPTIKKLFAVHLVEVQSLLHLHNLQERLILYIVSSL